jgi:hypothetical protein
MELKKTPRFTFSPAVEEAVRDIIREEMDRKEKGLPQKEVPTEGDPRAQ